MNYFKKGGQILHITQPHILLFEYINQRDN
jgi:hypothetical protein